MLISRLAAATAALLTLAAAIAAPASAQSTCVNCGVAARATVVNVRTIVRTVEVPQVREVTRVRHVVRERVIFAGPIPRMPQPIAAPVYHAPRHAWPGDHRGHVYHAPQPAYVNHYAVPRLRWPGDRSACGC